MPKRSCLAIILAAGEGTRMKSTLPKVMHPIGGMPMLGHVLKAAAESGATDIAVVAGPGADAVAAYVGKAAPGVAVFTQTERRGTAHAVLAARKAIGKGADDVIVLFGDTPLVTAKTIGRIRKALAGGADVAVVGFETAEPKGYGRLIVEKGSLTAIIEEKDASPEERRITFCNAGIMGLAGAGALRLLGRIGSDNAQKQFYLTDAVALANRARRKVVAIEADADEVSGINTRGQLAHVEGIFQRHAREAAMAAGATLIAPSTVWFSHDTKFGRDVTVEPNVFFGPGVTVADGATIRGFSHIEGASIASGAVVGPFARLRPGTSVGEKARVGNFVEVKNGAIDRGAKVNHLTYIGDAHVGAGANVGAGTITCNYDGFGKYHTEIGAGAFIGSNSALVAPVTIGEGAYVGSGSVITQDVPKDALAIGRGRQVNKEGLAAMLRASRGARKKRD
jgi:bifunctional UDP-N-acetylglucosamine pyrophosphorylase/glucosamine-1-phosphate N-acetyltransferase